MPEHGTKVLERNRGMKGSRWLYLDLGDHRKLLLPLRLEEVLFSEARLCGLLWLLLWVITLHVSRTQDWPLAPL